MNYMRKKEGVERESLSTDKESRAFALIWDRFIGLNMPFVIANLVTHLAF